MSNILTSTTTLTTAEGKRLSMTYSVLDDSGKITSTNNRINRVVTDSAILEAIAIVESYAQSLIENI